MEQSMLLQLGVGVTAAILILREVFGFLKSFFKSKAAKTDSQDHDTAAYVTVDGQRDRDRLTKLESSDKSQWRKLNEISDTQKEQGVTQKEHTEILIRIDERTKKQNGGH